MRATKSILSLAVCLSLLLEIVPGPVAGFPLHPAFPAAFGHQALTGSVTFTVQPIKKPSGAEKRRSAPVQRPPLDENRIRLQFSAAFFKSLEKLDLSARLDLMKELYDWLVGIQDLPSNKWHDLGEHLNG